LSLAIDLFSHKTVEWSMRLGTRGNSLSDCHMASLILPPAPQQRRREERR